MNKFLDLYDIVECSRADDHSLTITVKPKNGGDSIKFTYNQDEKPNNPLAKMLYNELHSTVSDSLSGNLENMAAQIRCDRYNLLCSTDSYLAIPDYPITDSQRDEIKIYRQALRDITKQDGFPENVVWPEIPDCIKNKINRP